MGPDGTTAWYSSRLGPIMVDGQVVSVVHTSRVSPNENWPRKRCERARRSSEPCWTPCRTRSCAFTEMEPAWSPDRPKAMIERICCGTLSARALLTSYPTMLPTRGWPASISPWSKRRRSVLNTRLHRLAGQRRDYEASFVSSGADEVLVIVHDITQRRQAERAALATERQFRQLVERAPVCILQIDLTAPTPLIRTANRRAELVYGLPAESLKSCPLSQLFANETVADLAKLMERIAQGQTITMESRHQRSDGTLFPVRMSAAPEAESEARRMIFTVEDITVEKPAPFRNRSD